MQFNRDSNGYILVFLLAMVFVVAVSLSFVNSALDPTIKQNQIVDTKTQILKSVVQVPEGKSPSDVFTQEFVLNEYDNKIEEIMVNHLGEPIDLSTSEETPFQVAQSFKKELKKPEDQRRYPVFLYSAQDGGTYSILPLSGLGLWDAIWGYLAVGKDFNTIKGAAFDHKAETPGLGARITEQWYGEQFEGKKLFDGDYEYNLMMKKGENNPEVDTDPYVVDGLSGATLTAQGLATMIENGALNYKPYFNKSRNN